MDILFEQRQILGSLFRYGYIGNWYTSPNKSFLRVYLASERADVYVSVQFDIRMNVIDVMFGDPTVPLFYMVEFKRKFSNLISAIKEVAPNAFDDYAIYSTDLEDFGSGDYEGQHSIWIAFPASNRKANP